MADKPHHQLQAWKDAMALAGAVYTVTRSYPREEQFGLAVETRRAALAVASSIADGASRRWSRDFAERMTVALAAMAELDTQLTLARDLGYVTSSAPVFGVYDRTMKSVQALHQRVR
jgi:four helix bundle protein